MMYGTRKELNKKLKRMFGNNDHFALLVWTKQDVMARVENMTESEAAAILQEIGSVTGHTEEGISFRTVQRCMPDYGPTSRPSSFPLICWPA